MLADGSLVAVKREKEERTPVGELQFQTEVDILSMVAHRNLLRLCGFCMTPTERMLVYAYMSNGSVASHLRERPGSEPPLDWQTRRRIALGSARGLSYLHDNCDPRIIHGDVKAANILLDEDFEAVVGDFGLAKLMDNKDTDINTEVSGTIGHIAPEYLLKGKSSEKTDVFGYGIMLLELLTGQRAIDLTRVAKDDNASLLDWVKGLLENKKLEDLVDNDLKDNYVEDEVESLIQIALLCTQSDPIKRPKMSEVVRMLEGDGPLAERWERKKLKSAFNLRATIGTSSSGTGAIGFPSWPLKMQKHLSDTRGDQKRHLGQAKQFSLRELQVATDNFSERNIIGRGAFGKIYRGTLANRSLVAVKRKEERTHIGELQFQTEVHILSMVIHRNILRLHGFCKTRKEMLLVYAFMANGSVGSRLRERPVSEPPLDWQTRRRIALGSARGLSYLHYYCEQMIIHGDVKVANIWLDEDFEAVLGEFDLAQLMDNDDSNVKGLLEEKKLDNLVDNNLNGKYIYVEVESLIQIALLCTQSDPKERPNMIEVVRMLEGDVGLAERWEEWKKLQVVHQVVELSSPPREDWIVESAYDPRAVELSGPR
ncbi:hypothetical protein HU200_057080 [Digitaria exilis]|uniref:non-specific serine/threonine protein kinase n=1 Tax=Digitaria exilis TaxID=1010633 RepID=A0A835ALE4_9POAL|nr:hypothetical protein HU200_057080 [Digitaria exilis]